jgi:hypothetical protein
LKFNHDIDSTFHVHEELHNSRSFKGATTMGEGLFLMGREARRGGERRGEGEREKREREREEKRERQAKEKRKKEASLDSFKYNQQDATLYNILYYFQRSTCFGRFLRPSSGAQELYTPHLVRARLAAATASVVGLETDQPR